MISSGMSSKILKQALIQQKEILAEERNPNFNALEEELPEPEGEECAEDQIDDFRWNFIRLKEKKISGTGWIAALGSLPVWLVKIFWKKIIFLF